MIEINPSSTVYGMWFAASEKCGLWFCALVREGIDENLKLLCLVRSRMGQMPIPIVIGEVYDFHDTFGISSTTIDGSIDQDVLHSNIAGAWSGMIGIFRSIDSTTTVVKDFIEGPCSGREAINILARRSWSGAVMEGI